MTAVASPSIMNSATPAITSTDRLGLTLFFAVVIHALIILGITFIAPDEKPANDQPTLEIILATNPGAKKITNPDFLAQAHQEGGGNQDTPHKPTSQPTAPATSRPLAGGAPVTQFSGATPPVATPAPIQITTLHNPQQKVTSEIAPASTPTETPASADMVMRSLEIARLSAELNSSMQAYARRPKHRFISARTAEFRDAAYMAAWQAKIEMIGNLNYPEEARRRNIAGSLLLDVALNHDGSVNDISVRRSSGHKVLDDAAIRIVNQAAPFSPLPLEMRKETDILHIIRTWQFLENNRLVTDQ